MFAEIILKNFSGQQKRLREKESAQTFQLKLLQEPDLLEKKTCYCRSVLGLSV
jgi:hypothetical protein